MEKKINEKYNRKETVVAQWTAKSTPINKNTFNTFQIKWSIKYTQYKTWAFHKSKLHTSFLNSQINLATSIEEKLFPFVQYERSYNKQLRFNITISLYNTINTPHFNKNNSSMITWLVISGVIEQLVICYTSCSGKRCVYF